MIDKELTQDLMDRLVTESQKPITLSFVLNPHEVYILLSLVQLAVHHPDVPELPKEFGKVFIKQFWNRYRQDLPAMAESFDLADHENFLMTREEFDDLVDDDYEDDFASTTQQRARVTPRRLLSVSKALGIERRFMS